MTLRTSTPKKGYDAWVDSADIHARHGSAKWMQLQTATKRGYLWLPITPRVIGRTIASAILTGHAHNATSAQTLTFAPAAGKWQAGTITWSNQPTTRAGTATAVLGALADGAEFTVDLTTLVQQVADGQAHYGWRITTNAATVQKVSAFDSGVVSWTLTIEYAEEPEAPTALVPNGSQVGAQKPVVTFDFHDFGGDSTDLSYVRVEVDSNNDLTYDWDSGWIASTEPALDLAAAGMPGVIASGQTVGWRAYVKDGAGLASDPSDRATYTYVPLPTLILDSPAAGVLYDPTSDILAHITGGTLAAYHIWVTDGDDRTAVRFNSRKLTADDPTNIAYQLPLKNDDKSRIFTDDLDYQIHVRAFPTGDWQSTPGVPAYVDLWTTVHFDDDLALDRVTSFQAAQVNGTPFVQLTWTDAAAADAYLVARDDVHIARLLPADTVAGVSTYSWRDTEAAPAVKHIYDVRRLTLGVGRSKSRQTAITIEPEGVWLLRDNGDYVVLDGTGVDQLSTPERWSLYQPRNGTNNVGILDGYNGITGPLVLSIEDDVDQTVAQAKKVLNAIKRNAASEAVQLIYASVSKPVRVMNMTVLPDPDYRGDMNRHVVSFAVEQTGDFDFKVD